MIRINLLPHRAERRKRRQIQFALLSAVSVLVGVAIIAIGYGVISARIAYQEGRNEFLKREIAKLDTQIEEIKKLREQVRALMARKEVVENLQATRSDVVHLLDQMLRILPDGVYLRSLRQAGDQITITGLAQSNARVSTLMRAIQNSPWLNTPTLVEIHSTMVAKERLSEFTMTFNLTRAQPGAKPAAAPAGTAGKPAPAQPVATPPVATPAPAAGPAPSPGKAGEATGKPGQAGETPASAAKPAPVGPAPSPAKAGGPGGKPGPAPAPAPAAGTVGKKG